MGSLKDKMRAFKDNHKPSEKADDGGCSGGSDNSMAPGEALINTTQVSTSQGDSEPGVHMNTSYKKEREENQMSKEQEPSAGTCDDTDQSDYVGVKRSKQAVVIPLIQPPDASEAASVTQSTTVTSSSFMSGRVENQEHEDENTNNDGGKGAHVENVLVPVPSTPDLTDPWSPAPAGQHHIRTQVNLEVVTCQSAATSPMTPAEDGHSFFFPGAFVRGGAVDAELQVGKQVEFCSVATSPMTPKTPSTTAFPLLFVNKEEKVKKMEKQAEGDLQGDLCVKHSPAEAESGIKQRLKGTTSTELSEDRSSNASAESFVSCHAAKQTDSHGILNDRNQQCNQQKMGSMDQDITIMVTHYNNNEEEESSLCAAETAMVKIDAPEEPGGSHSEERRKDGKRNVAETVPPDYVEDTSAEAPPPNQTSDEETSIPAPASPAPFRCHSIHTQVILEVVQCQSAATSPMTPPEGEYAFNFPTFFGKCTSVGTETKDAELQVRQQVEYRSVATAPMTPRTPTATAFPESKGEATQEQKSFMEKEDRKQQEKEVFEEEEKIPEEQDFAAVEEDMVVVKCEENVPEQENVAAVVQDNGQMSQKEKKVPDENKAAENEVETKEAGNCKDKVEEPVQDVSWDEKGMTWEVYGAVVEVTVLGSAIQKHLEKQVKKRQPNVPPPPPLSPSESRQASTKGQMRKRNEQDGEASRRRRNPFRQMMETMQQPHCCSKAHTTE